MLCGQPRVAQDLYKECLTIGIECLSFPEFGDELDDQPPTEGETEQPKPSATASGDS